MLRIGMRFYRIDNGTIGWYNVDLPGAMEVRIRFHHVPDDHDLSEAVVDCPK